MLIFNLLSNPVIAIGFIVGILIAITIHEALHAYVAYKCGDATAKLEGRVSLNPLVHLDLFGTIMLFLVGFGWGKPVPVNPHNFRSKYDELKVSLAGIAGNAALAILIALVARFIKLPYNIDLILVLIIQLNLNLMIFNLLPIPPLDGSSLLKAILPEHAYHTLQTLSAPLFITFIFFMYASPIIPTFISNVTSSLLHFLIG